MHHNVQRIGLYGNLVSHYHHYGAEEFNTISTRDFFAPIFQMFHRIVFGAMKFLLQRTKIQFFYLTLFAAVAAMLLGFPLIGRAEEVANATVPAAAEPVSAEKRDLLAAPEKFNATAQTTWIVSEHGSFRSPYIGTNSLLSKHEKAYTWTITAYLGFRPFANTEIYFDPEMIQSNQFSGLHGLGAFNNNENQKAGEITPTFYRARLFARQTWNLGGEKIKLESGANQLAGVVDHDRVVLTVGNISTPDIFDINLYAHDARTQFLNWALYTHIASDFAADGRGYTWGTALEYYKGNWAYRIGQFTQPKESNGLYLEHSLTRHGATQFEIEHSHDLSGQPGKVRLFAFRNHAAMGNFDEALAYQRAMGDATPDLANVRRNQNKIGAGLNFEQSLTDNVGVFGRYGFNNGKTETFQFSEADRSVSGGISVKGALWGREKDTFGFAVANTDISKAHRAYLAAGGLGAFIGDGKLPNYRSERLIEAYYSFALYSHASLSADFQRISNPAYNGDRGPVNIGALRLHVEY